MTYCHITVSVVLVSTIMLLSAAGDVWAKRDCGNACAACVRRYGCMTPAYGKCCTQFYAHNGRKRSEPQEGAQRAELLEYIMRKLQDNKQIGLPEVEPSEPRFGSSDFIMLIYEALQSRDDTQSDDVRDGETTGSDVAERLDDVLGELAARRSSLQRTLK